MKPDRWPKDRRPAPVKAPPVLSPREVALSTVALSEWLWLDAGVLMATLNRCSPPIPGELRTILYSLVEDMKDQGATASLLEAKLARAEFDLKRAQAALEAAGRRDPPA